MRIVDRISIALLYLFVVGSPLSISVGSIVAGLFIVLGTFRLLTTAEARAAVPRAVWVTFGLWIAWSLLTAALADPYPTRFDKVGEELWIKLLLPTVAALGTTVPRHLARALVVYLGVGALIGIYGIYQHYTGDQWFTDEWIAGIGNRWNAVGFYGHKLTYGGHVVCLWLLGVAFATNSSPGQAVWRHRLFVVAAGALVSIGLLLSHARSAQLGGALGAAVIALYLPPTRRRIAVGILLLAALGAVATPTIRDRFVRAFDFQAEQTRPNLWQTSLDALDDRPWTGYGFGNFEHVLDEYEVEGLYESRAHAHNDVLMVAVNSGWPGAVLFLAFAAAVAVGTARAVRRAGPWSWIVLGGFAAHLALLLGGLFQVYQTDDEVELTLYFLLGCAFAAAAAGARRDRALSR